MVTASDFKEAFIKNFRDARLESNDFSINRRSHYMLWEKDSVINRTAHALGLSPAIGEPLRLDAVLLKRNEEHAWRRLPMHVAVEHENDAYTLDQEMRVLLAVRAPLKVAISYFRSNGNTEKERLKAWLKTQWIKEFELASEILQENAQTEYLMLVGEDDGSATPFAWQYIFFTAAAGPYQTEFFCTEAC